MSKLAILNKMRRFTLIGIIAGFTTSAIAFTDAQEKVLGEVAGANVAAMACPNVTLNNAEALKMLLEVGIVDRNSPSLIPPEAYEYMKTTSVNPTLLRFFAQEHDAACRVMWMQYGTDEGISIGKGHHGLLIRK